MKNKHYIIGITGRIGSGKSTVTESLKQEGAFIINCDEVVHDLYEPNGQGTKKIQTFFGEEYLNKRGGVNRKKLSRTLVKTPKKWVILNRMIHPLVADQLQRRLRKAPPGLVAIEIPIYNEKLFKPFLNELWFVDVEQATRWNRIQDRKLTPEYLKAIEAQQKDLSRGGVRLIDNNQSKEELAQKTHDLLDALNIS